MSSAPAVTMQALELEHAELLPVRVTLYLWGPPPASPGGPFRGWPPAPVGGYPHPPVGGCAPPPHASAGPSFACPM